MHSENYNKPQLFIVNLGTGKRQAKQPQLKKITQTKSFIGAENFIHESELLKKCFLFKKALLLVDCNTGKRLRQKVMLAQLVH